MRKQSEAVTTEYDRLLEEHRKLQVRSLAIETILLYHTHTVTHIHTVTPFTIDLEGVPNVRFPYIHVHAYIHTYMYMHTYIHTCTYIRTYVHINIHGT